MSIQMPVVLDLLVDGGIERPVESETVRSMPRRAAGINQEEISLA
jgi:hypothetical protein